MPPLPVTPEVALGGFLCKYRQRPGCSTHAQRPTLTFAVGNSWRHGSRYIPCCTLEHLNNIEVPFCAGWASVDVLGSLYLTLLHWEKRAKSWAQAKFPSATAIWKTTQKSEVVLKQYFQLCCAIWSPVFLIFLFLFVFFFKICSFPRRFGHFLHKSTLLK